MPPVLLARLSEIPAGGLTCRIHGTRQVMLARVGDAVYAIDDVCTHENFLLSGGELFGLDVECPQHGSRFNLQTGKVTGLPAVINTTVYPVEVVEDEVYVDV